MSYVVLARKYRPQTFEEMVGQLSVSQTLLNALESGRVAHAYVFSGPRGIGKTTTARLLAKCLNCAKGPTKTPCNACDSCRSITENTSIDDVLEIDGASNRGIEQIRELRESAKYAPARSRYRIYIIDEAHQITKDAFGALLKTLEEPPPHVVFMMATTEVQKIPSAILSRCQRFALRPISPELVFNHLKEICKKEKVAVDDHALGDIVRFVEGSLRDALSLLDQAIVFAPTGITSSTIRDLLGLLPSEMIQQFAEKIQQSDPSLVLQAISQAVQDGIDLTQLGKDLQSYYHDLLLSKAGVTDAFAIDAKKFQEAATRFDFPTLERNIRLLSRALDDMRHSEAPRAVFEVYALRLAQKTLDPRIFIEQLQVLSSSPNLSRERELGSVPPPARPTTGGLPESLHPTLPPSAKSDRRGDGSGEATATVESNEGANSNWVGFIADVESLKHSLASALEDSTREMKGGRLVITFGKAFHNDMVVRSMDILRPLFAKHFGAATFIETRVAPSVPSADKNISEVKLSEPVKQAIDPGFEEVAALEMGAEIQTALKHFPGTLKREKKKS